MKRICLIGSGNVAEALACALSALGSEPSAPTGEQFRLERIYARNRDRGRAIAQMVGCSYTDNPAELQSADIILIAVSDSQIGQVAELIPNNEAIIAHTAGCVSWHVLPERLHHRGVFYPLQTFTAGRKVNFREIPLLIEGEDQTTVTTLIELANALSDNVHQSTESQRAQLHLAAVFACNFTNRMYAIAQQLLEEAHLPASLIGPLIGETARKAMESPSAAAVQTGPARRGDLPTQQRHLELLAQHPQWQELYRKISNDIWETSKKI